MPRTDASGNTGKSHMIDIVVVDDDALLRALLAEWLEGAGYAVRVAESCEIALRMLRQHPAGLLITDMDMPGGDGAHTMSQARSLAPAMPVIAMSGGARRPARDWTATALGLGAATTLAKPFDRDALLAAVEAVALQGKYHGVRG